ncbi:suppressor of fused domain protein [Mucilaginibacter sp. CAU 1740]|uniref:suppressor of fused domain protein n=1 Tax=Mucilaginibacter sp. CAU 1740 TaxID=3140365 RepID=UPI00325B6386
MDAYNSLIKAHYASIWGDGFEKRKWNKGPINELGDNLSIWEFRPTETRKMWTYATVGMSTFTHKTPLELHMFSAVQDESILELLTAAAYYHSTENNLGLNHTVDFGGPWQGASVCSYGLISLPYLDGPKLELLDPGNGNKAIACYWLIPITLQEREYKMEYGIEALEEKFEQKGFNYLDPERESVV